MLKWLENNIPAVFFAFCILFTFQTVYAQSEVSYEIAEINATLTGDQLNYVISGTSKPAYTVSERFAPFRVVVDIAGASFKQGEASAVTEFPQNSFSSLKISDLTDQEPSIKRFEFTLSDSHDYSVKPIPNGLEIVFSPEKTSNSNPESAAQENIRSLTSFAVNSTPNTTTISIVSNGPIENYIVDTIGSGVNRPPRMFIDIEDVDINELVREKVIGSYSIDRIRVATRGKGVRIVFDSAKKELFKYSVTPTGNGLNVVIDESKAASQGTVQTKQPDMAGSTADSTLDELIDSSEKLLSQDPEQLVMNSAESKAVALENDFSFSGYKKQKISVDFYKIDIHNVFRLFRQITDLNIIVDEDVSGSLTLALNDVPWDFALDIILNLMDLKKEERFNTIVIYPAKKGFVWPTRAEDNLSFEADIEIIEEEALVIEKSASQSAEITKAKEFILKARTLEKRDEFEDAALFYIKAMELWPDNPQIANRLATLYLVNLGMNAKAVHYAKKSLEKNPENRKAALYAAIGSANMQRLSEANDYFAQAISEDPPMKEALISYAAFSENNGQNDAALKLLDKYHSHYGETVNTMVSKARIYDKLGLSSEAQEQYKAILTSGFALRPDLKKFIKGRLAAKSIN